MLSKDELIAQKELKSAVAMNVQKIGLIARKNHLIV